MRLPDPLITIFNNKNRKHIQISTFLKQIVPPPIPPMLVTNLTPNLLPNHFLKIFRPIMKNALKKFYKCLSKREQLLKDTFIGKLKFQIYSKLIFLYKNSCGTRFH